MPEAPNQLVEYIEQSLRQGTSETDIQNQLMASGWPQNSVEEAFNLARYQVQSSAGSSPQPSIAPRSGAQTKQAILWIVSPFIILIGSVILNLLLRSVGITSAITNVFFLLLGLAGTVMIFVGPIVGIIKLSHH